MRVKTAFLVCGLVTTGCPGILAAQTSPGPQPPTCDEVSRVVAVHGAVAAVATALGGDLWPGFRPDAGPVLYTGLGRSVLMDWPGELPGGFRPIEHLPNAGWSSQPDYPVLIAGGTTLTSLDSSYSLPAATALAVHEHFHAHQRQAASEGRGWGQAERPAEVRSYPVFDTLNTVLAALEGRLLSTALAAEGEKARTRMREFVAVRTHRQARLPEEVGRWERLTERNEGLADYTGIRTLEWLEKEDYSGWGATARQDLDRDLARLTELVELAERSVRYRFYATGSAQALALDRISPGW